MGVGASCLVRFSFVCAAAKEGDAAPSVGGSSRFHPSRYTVITKSKHTMYKKGIKYLVLGIKKGVFSPDSPIHAKCLAVTRYWEVFLVVDHYC